MKAGGMRSDGARLLLAAIAVALAGACVSTPETDLYTLDMTSSGAAEPGVNVKVEPLGAVDPLERPELLVQATPTRLEYYAVDQWAGDLGDLVRRKLEAELGPPVEGRPEYTVFGTVLSFQEVDGTRPKALAEIHLGVRDDEALRYEEPIFEATYRVERPLEEAGADGLVRALSRAVEEIAAEFASDLAEHHAARDAEVSGGRSGAP